MHGGNGHRWTALLELRRKHIEIASDADRLTRWFRSGPSDNPSRRERHQPRHGKSGSHETRRWREMDSNPRSPVYGELAAPGRARRPGTSWSRNYGPAASKRSRAVPALIADLGYGPAKSGCVSSLSYSAATAVSGSHIRGSYFTVVRPSDDRPSSMVIKRSPWNAGLSSSAR
jgi:hypothetical protein